MITLVVIAQIKQQNYQDFINECLVSQLHTLEENGCSSYTINIDGINKDTVILIESYYNEEAIEEHKKTQHFVKWRENIFPYVVQRETIKYISI